MQTVDISCKKIFGGAFPDCHPIAIHAFSYRTGGKNDEWSHELDSYCYAPLMNQARDYIIPYVFIRFGEEKLKDAGDFYKDYLMWLINESPVADAFYCKDISRLHTHGLQLNTNNHPLFMLTGAMLARVPIEYPHIQSSMKVMRGLDFSWIEATSFSLRYQVKYSGKDGTDVLIHPNINSGHLPFAGEFRLADWKYDTFQKNVPYKHPGIANARVVGYYGSTSAAWGYGTGKRSNQSRVGIAAIKELM